MAKYEIRFLSGNEHKIREANEILSHLDIAVSPLKYSIEELQSIDTPRLVKDKALKAFKRVGEPLFVEHTGLYLQQLNGLPSSYR